MEHVSQNKPATLDSASGLSETSAPDFMSLIVSALDALKVPVDAAGITDCIRSHFPVAKIVDRAKIPFKKLIPRLIQQALSKKLIQKSGTLYRLSPGVKASDFPVPLFGTTRREKRKTISQGSEFEVQKKLKIDAPKNEIDAVWDSAAAEAFPDLFSDARIRMRRLMDDSLKSVEDESFSTVETVFESTVDQAIKESHLPVWTSDTVRKMLDFGAELGIIEKSGEGYRLKAAIKQRMIHDDLTNAAADRIKSVVGSTGKVGVPKLSPVKFVASIVSALRTLDNPAGNTVAEIQRNIQESFYMTAVTAASGMKLKDLVASAVGEATAKLAIEISSDPSTTPFRRVRYKLRDDINLDDFQESAPVFTLRWKNRRLSKRQAGEAFDDGDTGSRGSARVEEVSSVEPGLEVAAARVKKQDSLQSGGSEAMGRMPGVETGRVEPRDELEEEFTQGMSPDDGQNAAAGGTNEQKSADKPGTEIVSKLTPADFIPCIVSALHTLNSPEGSSSPAIQRHLWQGFYAREIVLVTGMNARKLVALAALLAEAKGIVEIIGRAGETTIRYKLREGVNRNDFQETAAVAKLRRNNEKEERDDDIEAESGLRTLVDRALKLLSNTDRWTGQAIFVSVVTLYASEGDEAFGWKYHDVEKVLGIGVRKGVYFKKGNRYGLPETPTEEEITHKNVADRMTEMENERQKAEWFENDDAKKEVRSDGNEPLSSTASVPFSKTNCNEIESSADPSLPDSDSLAASPAEITNSGFFRRLLESCNDGDGAAED